MNQKVLIISYYWPPSGGAGVQRWLKLSKYLAKMGLEVHVISVDPNDASYMQVDESLVADIHPDVKVHLTPSFEPINYYAKMVGKKNVPVAGFSNVDNQSGKQKLMNAIRSNFFIPDPRRGWNKYAYEKAVEVIDANQIQQVITTSPPHSSQLVGLKLKKRYGSQIRWISDFRDPWTDIYYYPLLGHTKISHAVDKRYEKQVVENCDHMIAAGQRFKESMISKSNRITEEKCTVITNGFDPADFEGQNKPETFDSGFTVSYIGTMSDHYHPEVFIDAYAKLIQNHPESDIKLRMVGIVSPKITAEIESKIGDRAEFVPPVSHDEAINYMVNTNVLLLITQGEEGTIPGKTFEYLAAQRRILCIGTGDAGKAISKCESGAAFERNNESGIYQFLEQALADYNQQQAFEVNKNALITFSREFQAEQVAEVLKK